MEWIFHTDSQSNIILDPDVVKLCPEFSLLSLDEVRYIAMVYDYVKSPYRFMAQETRRNHAIQMIWKGQTGIRPEKNEKIRQGIIAYKSMIYCPKRETREKLIEKKQVLDMNLIAESDPKKLREIIDATDIIQKRIEVYTIEIDREKEEIITIKGGKQLSLIEIYQRNRKKFRKDKGIGA